MKPVTVSFQPRMNIEQIEIREHLRSREPFSFLDDAELEQVARSVQVSYFRAGSTVVARGARFEELHYIRSGSVEVMGRAGELQNRMGEGQIFGQLGILSGRPARHEARAEEDTLIYFIPAGVFESLLDSNADFADHVEIEERQRLRQAVERGTGKHPLLTLKAGRLVRTAPLLISASTPVQEAARRMNEQHSSAVLVYRDSHAEEREEQGGAADAKAHKPGQEEIRLAGILTDSDFRRRVVAGGLPGSTPVGEIMTGDIVGIQADQYLFEALLLMLRSDIHHLPVLDHQRPVGVLDLADVVHNETQNSLFVVRNIMQRDSVDELEDMRPSVAASFVRMVSEDANSRMIGAAMATIGRSFKQRLAELAEQQLGPPPVPYCLVALGSMARDEQLLYTDQDNALILDDSYDPGLHNDYFSQLAKFVCDGLHRAGYTYCTGDVMATNPQWRQPLSVWKQNFEQWISEPDARRLLHSSIFFDLDGVAGMTSLADELKALVAEKAAAHPAFLGCLAINARRRTPPLGFFRDFVLERSGKHANSINLKRRGTAPLVDVIRIHALAAGSLAQNSFQRLDDVIAAGFLTAGMGANLRDALEFISIVRARHQAYDAERGGAVNNNIDPETLSAFERRSLKDAFRVLANAQKFIRFRYRPVRRGQP